MTCVSNTVDKCIAAYNFDTKHLGDIIIIIFIIMNVKVN